MILVILLILLLYLLIVKHMIYMSERRNVSIMEYSAEIFFATIMFIGGMLGLLSEDIGTSVFMLVGLFWYSIKTNSLFNLSRYFVGVAGIIERVFSMGFVLYLVIIFIGGIAIYSIVNISNGIATGGGQNYPDVNNSPGTHKVEPHWVDGYTKDDGTQVDGYWRGGEDGYYRSNPDGIKENNLNQ